MQKEKIENKNENRIIVENISKKFKIGFKKTRVL
jgi:hypothetical protein